METWIRSAANGSAGHLPASVAVGLVPEEREVHRALFVEQAVADDDATQVAGVGMLEGNCG